MADAHDKFEGSPLRRANSWRLHKLAVFSARNPEELVLGFTDLDEAVFHSLRRELWRRAYVQPDGFVVTPSEESVEIFQRVVAQRLPEGTELPPGSNTDCT